MGVCEGDEGGGMSFFLSFFLSSPPFSGRKTLGGGGRSTDSWSSCRRALWRMFLIGIWGSRVACLGRASGILDQLSRDK